MLYSLLVEGMKVINLQTATDHETMVYSKHVLVLASV